MSESQEVFGTKQLADSLGLGSAMVRKYAVAYEKVTGTDIPLKRRDGRQFSREHFEVISKAKALVDANNGLSVETALRMALATPESRVEALVAPKTTSNTLELTEALTAAIAKGNEPLLAELRELRLELAGSQGREEPSKEKRDKTEADFINNLDNDDFIDDLGDRRLERTFIEKDDGVLVRWARRVERILKRGARNE